MTEWPMICEMILVCGRSGVISTCQSLAIFSADWRAEGLDAHSASSGTCDVCRLRKIAPASVCQRVAAKSKPARPNARMVDLVRFEELELAGEDLSAIELALSISQV